MGRGESANADDCDDTRAECHPSAHPSSEDCEAGADCDCDGTVDPTCDWRDLPVIDVGAVGSYLGMDVQTGVDVTGDGLGDMVAGAPQEETGPYVAVYAAPIVLGSSPVARLLGDDGVSWLGEAVAVADFDDDGHGDVVSTGGSRSSTVYAWYGPLAGDVPSAAAAWTLEGGGSYGSPETALEAGDLTGDGQEDLVVGFPSYEEGGFLVYSPGAGGAADAGDLLAGTVATATRAGGGHYHAGDADLDGDGQVDLVVSAATADGGVGETRVHYGPLTSIVTWEAADVTIRGTGADTNIGRNVDTTADLDEDGLPEVFLPRYDGACLMGASVPGEYLTTDAPWQVLAPSGWETPFYANYGTAVVEDLDADGTMDLAIGNEGTNADYMGVLAILTGPVASGALLSDAALSWRGPDNYEGMGAVVRSLGDQDGDGRPDLVTTNASYAGFGYLLLVEGALLR